MRQEALTDRVGEGFSIEKLVSGVCLPLKSRIYNNMCYCKEELQCISQIRDYCKFWEISGFEGKNGDSGVR